ncbi:hypothetical protein SBRCBS47491_009778 [Sporothrix bragantina]|uniref:Zinc finger PHD-type domain-containing protein n=1 Tax=Sporothrix bragantina TaxID=671064 RepID=A0ABP0CXH8_9PEZI
MTSFIMMNPEKLREKMAEQKDADHDQTTWRIEPFGWDRDDRVYFVLDDNRVYRLTEALPPPPKPKKNTKKARAQARRNGKRRRVSSSALDNAIDGAEDDDEKFADGQPQAEAADAIAEEDIDDGLGGMKWECVAVTLDDLRKLLSSISSKKDPNERVLHDKIAEHLLPILEQQEEKRKRREKEREKELLNLAKMASAKRSSRIAGRQEQQRQEEIIREEEQKRRLEMEAQRKEEQKQRKIEKEREARLLTREKRLHEREVRRAQHEDELAHLSEDNKALENAAGRMSERRRQAEIEKNKEALRELEEEGEEEEWTFDCICGLHGKIDDGQHSVACEKCNIWQHSKCLNIDEHEAEKDDFHFICNPCKRKAAAAANGHPNGRPIIRIKVNKSAAAAETATKAATEAAAKTTSETPLNPLPFSINIPSVPPSEPPAPKSVAPSLPESIPELSTGVKAESNSVGGPSAVPHLPGPPASNNGISRIPVKTDGSASLPILISAGKPSLGPTTGSASPAPGPLHDTLATSLLSLPRPDLPQPDQSPRRSHAAGQWPVPSGGTATFFPYTGGSYSGKQHASSVLSKNTKLTYYAPTAPPSRRRPGG